MTGARGPRIRVVVVNYNSGAWLARCLEGLERQTWRGFDVVVVDNASSDGSFTDARARFGWVHFLANTANLGFAAACNLGARHTTGGPAPAWIATLNPDAIPDSDWMAQLVAATHRHPTTVMFGSTQVIAEAPHRLDGAGDAYFAAGLPWRSGYGHDIARLPAEGEVFGPCAAAALYEAEAFHSAGGFDESFFCYCEDVDLAFRLRLMGARAVQVPTARVRHVGSAIAGRGSDFQRYHGTRNRIWTFVKNMPGPLFVALLPAHIALNMAFLLWALIRGHTRPVWRGLADALRGLPAAWIARRAIQRTRTAGIGEIAEMLAWSPLAPIRRDTHVRFR